MRRTRGLSLCCSRRWQLQEAWKGQPPSPSFALKPLGVGEENRHCTRMPQPPPPQSTIIMGVARRETGVLKLVHPGGFVEVHRKPIAAAEIMAKNPRHYVTRPEVFKNPRLVVRPDSQLNTGDVFYIVPNHTLYRLQASP